MTDLFDSFDVLASATVPIAATPLEANLEEQLSYPDAMGSIGNLCGLPAMSVPCGFTEKHLPVGLQLLAKAGDDFGVILAARTWQSNTDWHRKHPRVA
jgi:aspartyl-tRNA(Asn)/glutamyl-tRNA(Gln) amidotransferase subunit A